MHWLFKWIVVSWFALIAGIGTMLLIEHTQPIPERLRMLHLADCAPPCWIGITPGKSTINEARQRLEAVFNRSQDFAITYDRGAPEQTIVFYLYKKPDLEFRLDGW